MYKVRMSAKFRQDTKIARKRGYDMGKLSAVVDLLSKGISLPEKNRDHILSGSYAGYRECHIAPDWLLIYRVDANVLTLLLFRTGSHSDLM